MGTLVAKKYPTKLALSAADHTYVECGTGKKAWGCWGGKTGGTAFNSGSGSTERADAIAQSDEHAGIKVYLVNGVCHQAANRVLFPAGILVSTARGYSLSVSIFGVYGKAGAGSCYSPFEKHIGVLGDLQECAGRSAEAGGSMMHPNQGSAEISSYLRSVRDLYRLRGRESEDQDNGSRKRIHEIEQEIFKQEIFHRFNGKLPSSLLPGLLNSKHRADIEHQQLSEDLSNGHLRPVGFVRAFNEMTDRFQLNCANALAESDYQQMFGVSRDVRLVLADPDAVDASFGPGTAALVYGREIHSVR